ncbi:hypothetical protein E2C01_017150 [Portunus trituberculatus]|uniref:Uncharacterized protein n=1 Tax=Portunus trituberculatus TaxID=210409 RepID=A0A5B7DSN8_PORTR|nr:hypothetical protein [Portunus trituberculatus]
MHPTSLYHKRQESLVRLIPTPQSWLERSPNALTTIALTLLSSLARFYQFIHNHPYLLLHARRQKAALPPIRKPNSIICKTTAFSCYCFKSSTRLFCAQFLQSDFYQELTNFIVVTLGAALIVVSARGNLAPYSLLGLSYFFWVYQMTTRHHNIKKEEVKPAL